MHAELATGTQAQQVVWRGLFIPVCMRLPIFIERYLGLEKYLPYPLGAPARTHGSPSSTTSIKETS